MTSIARVSGMVKPLFEHDAVELAQQAGMRQAALKVTLRSYLLHGRLQGPYLQAGRRHELASVLQQQVMAPGSLWIADLGYWTLKWLRALSQGGVFFARRVQGEQSLAHPL